MQHKNIFIKNARVNNLKNVSVEIQRNKMVVITGVSGSGKSSLAYDTLYAEGQRRYVESLSSYARQFLARMDKPDVDYIHGISPAMAIQQKVSTSNPRSTVGTVTEIYDYLKVLFARIGRTYSPISGKLVTSDSVSDITDAILDKPADTKVNILSKVSVRGKGYAAELSLALQKGFTRIWENDEIVDIEDILVAAEKQDKQEFYLLIDRFLVSHDDIRNVRGRIADSVQTAYQEGHARCFVQFDKEPLKQFSEEFEADGIVFERPTPNLFSFNNPYGACPTCEGFGRVMGIDEDLVVPDKEKSVYEGAIACWKGESMSEYLKAFLKVADKYDFPIHRSYYALSEEEKDLLWTGGKDFMGIYPFFAYIETQHHKIQYRVMTARFRGYTTCPDCKGSRIRKDANYVKIDGYCISDFLMMELKDMQPIFKNLKLSAYDLSIGKRIFNEINARFDYLNRVGVDYLTLSRKVNTLSGGEMQRIRLATSLGSGLVGAMYILDEPSIGLHPRDTAKLITILESLRNQGNTVIIVEHDESVMQHADQLIDIGPFAGELGGEIIFNGNYAEMLASETSLTGQYLSGKQEIAVPTTRRQKRTFIRVENARLHNLKNVTVDIPLNMITVVTGVSGSGKTTLIQQVFYNAMRKHLGQPAEKSGEMCTLSGDLKLISFVEMVDQSPVSRSSRSNPVTYIKAYDTIRELYASQRMAQIKGLSAGSFSFNVEGGRCEECKGDGKITVEMQFLPDVELVCEACGGKRFKKSVLEVMYKGKNIYEVLDMTISEGLSFFGDLPKVADKLEVLNKVGLGYLRMGQSTDTFSGGEAQRMKLAFFLTQRNTAGTFYIFDEPTTGLHFDDIKKLLFAINQLVEKGNTVLIIEHNLDVIKCGDWIIDLGPEGGKNGGELLYQGTPEGLIGIEGSYTAKFLEGKV